MDWKPSPNFYKGKNKPQYFIIHVTDGSYVGAISWLCNPKSNASAHFVVARDGRCTKLVDETDGAWHAGVGDWNKKSIGIEHEGIVKNGTDYWTDIEMDTTATIMAEDSKRFNIPLDRAHVLGHREIKNKICPGHLMDGLNELIKKARIKAGYDNPPVNNTTNSTTMTEEQVAQIKKELQTQIDNLMIEKNNLLKAKDEMERGYKDELIIKEEVIKAKDITINNQLNMLKSQQIELDSSSDEIEIGFIKRVAKGIWKLIKKFRWDKRNLISMGRFLGGELVTLGSAMWKDERFLNLVMENKFWTAVITVAPPILANWFKNFFRKDI